MSVKNELRMRANGPLSGHLEGVGKLFRPNLNGFADVAPMPRTSQRSNFSEEFTNDANGCLQHRYKGV